MAKKKQRDGTFNYLAYEVVDPRPDDPRCYVGFGRGKAAWRHPKATKGSTLDRWLKELREAGLKPVPVWDGLVPMLVTSLHARYLAAFRRQQLRELGGCKLLDSRYKGVRHPLWEHKQRAIIRVSPDGKSERFASIRQASRTLGMEFEAVRRRVKQARPKRGFRDRNGYMWRLA